MKKYLEILLGIVLIAAVIYSNYRYTALWLATKKVLAGGVVCMVALIGLLLVILGISELKE